MSHKIQVRRGLQSDLPLLDEGEIGFSLDQKRTYIGSPSGNVELAKASQLADIVAKNVVYVTDFGARGDDLTDNYAAINDAITYALSVNKSVYYPSGIYRISQPLILTQPVKMMGDGARIKLTASADVVVQIGVDEGWIYGSEVNNIVIDGNGFAQDGLRLKAVINATVKDVRATNVTRAGLHLAWSQLGLIENYICSDNVEAFTTQPVNGILADTASSSANTIVNPTIEHVSGAGILGIALVNSVILNGTSEGNFIGIELGEEVANELTAVGNTVIGMDLEVNSGYDIVLLPTAYMNDFIGLKSGFESGNGVLIKSRDNYFSGGVTGSVTMSESSSNNRLDGVKLYGSTATLSDVGLNNKWSGVTNITTSEVLKDKGKGRTNNVADNNANIQIDATQSELYAVTCFGANVTISNPINPVDGKEIEFCIHNNSGSTLTVVWDAIFKIAGWVNPPNGFNRSVKFRYDANYGQWYCTAITQTNIPN